MCIRDRERLKAEPGFKIFVFHGALDELKPPSLEMMEGMPAASLPAGFNYYAGGHVHSRRVASLPGHDNIAFPGPLFATDYPELLQIAHGEERGFYIVEYGDEKVNEVRFVPIKVCDLVDLHYSVEGKSSAQAGEELAELASRTNGRGKVVLLTVEGKLSEGKTSDIDFFAIRKRISSSNPLIVLSNYSHLTSPELQSQPGPMKPVQLTERELFETGIAGVKSEEPKLTGKPGVVLALDLLKVLKDGKKENENKGEFEDRTVKAGFGVLGLKDVE